MEAIADAWGVWAAAAARLQEAASLSARRARNLLAPVATFGVVRFVSWDLRASAARAVPPGFEARELAAGELAAAARVFGRSPGSFHRRFRLGDRCFGAFREGQLVNVRWCAARPIEVPELDLFACPAPDEAYFYAAMTVAAQRGKGAAAATRGALEGALLAEGKKTGHAYVALDNFASIRTQHALHRTRDVGYLRLRGGRAHLFGSFGPPYYREADIPAPVGAALRSVAGGRS